MRIDDLPEDEYISVLALDGRRMECRILGSTNYDENEYIVCEKTIGEKEIVVLDCRELKGQRIPINEPTVTAVVEQFTEEHPEKIPEYLTENENIIVITDEYGNDLRLEVLDLIDENGKSYVVCFDADEEESEEVIIFQVNELGDEEEYFSVDDEKLLGHLFEVFQIRNAERFDFV